MIILGLDGASPKIVFDWAETGLLPEFHKLLRQSSFGTLWSISTSSAACWTSHLTGVRPSRSGIEGFLKGDRFARTEDILVKTYPEILSDQGYKVGLVNMPMTYPPLALENGFCVSGQLTPVGSEEYTYPRDLQQELEDYEIGIRYGNRRYGFVDDELEITLAQLREDVLRVESKRMGNALRLMHRMEWDLLFLLITGTDALQHYYWHELDMKEPKQTTIFELYRRIDEFVGKVRRDYPGEDILILSDHGFQRDYWETAPSRGTLIHKAQASLGKAVPELMKQSKLYSHAFDLFTRSIAVLARPKRVERRTETLIHTGNHDRKGVWIMNGKSIKRNHRLDIGFLDLNPIIMWLMGSPIPTWYDGQIVVDVFEHHIQAVYVETPLAVERAWQYDEDDRIVKERLEGLGYIEMVERDS